jgi:hypothetical protein
MDTENMDTDDMNMDDMANTEHNRGSACRDIAARILCLFCMRQVLCVY